MRSLDPYSTFATCLLFSSLASAVSLDCTHIQIDKKKFDLSKIGGPHTVLVRDESRPPSISNWTWAVDICQPLKKVKEIPDADQCPTGTWVCGKSVTWNPADDPDQEHPQVDFIIPVAGNFQTSSGRSLDPKVTRLKTTDSDLEGLQLELHGGDWGKKKQKAVINFECDKTRTGNEGNESTDKRMSARDDDEKKDDLHSLTYVSYGAVEGKEAMDVLRLNWKTKYACEDVEPDADDDGNVSKKASWGFFTWIILM